MRPLAADGHHHLRHGTGLVRIRLEQALAAIQEIGDFAEGDFPQAREVGFREEISHRLLDPVGRIDLTQLEPLDQIFRRQIDIHDLVCLGDDRIGNAFLDPDARGRLDHIAERFEMLDVERGDDTDAGLEQFLDVLVALVVAAARRVGMGKLIHQDDGRFALEDRGEVHFLDFDPVVGGHPRRNDFERADLRRRFRALVRLDIADDHVDAPLLQAISFHQHGVGLADAGGRTEVDLELAPGLPLDEMQEIFRRLAITDGRFLFHKLTGAYTKPQPLSAESSRPFAREPSLPSPFGQKDAKTCYRPAPGEKPSCSWRSSKSQSGSATTRASL